jgi:hypothetical protein
MSDWLFSFGIASVGGIAVIAIWYALMLCLYGLNYNPFRPQSDGDAP